MSANEAMKPLVDLVVDEVVRLLGPRLMPESPLTASQAAPIMNVPAERVRELVRDGQIKSIPNSPKILIPHNEVVRWNEGRES